MTNKIKNRYNRIAGLYDLMDAPMVAMFSQRRKQMLEAASAKTLEVGIGTGVNIASYPSHVDLTGIDFSEKMIEKARAKVGDRQNVRLMVMDAQQMDFEDNTFDTVVTTCVFCSVPNPVQGLKEIRRVCKNGGKILMLEHVRSHKRGLGKFMDTINCIPLNVIGANINRETYRSLLDAGFSPQSIKVENLWLDIVKLIEIDNWKDYLLLV